MPLSTLVSTPSAQEASLLILSSLSAGRLQNCLQLLLLRRGEIGQELRNKIRPTYSIWRPNSL